jgi:hypothetical protein
MRARSGAGNRRFRSTFCGATRSSSSAPSCARGARRTRTAAIRYLARHWYALALADGREAVVYFDRKARRGAAVWWLYTLADERDEKPG